MSSKVVDCHIHLQRIHIILRDHNQVSVTVNYVAVSLHVHQLLLYIRHIAIMFMFKVKLFIICV